MFSGMEYVYEVYKEKSFSNAAKNLFVSQPALSATVKRAEQRIGSPIFDRSTNPVKLTQCGEAYIRTVEKIMELENDFTNYVNDLNQLKTGHLAIGGSTLFSSYILPPLFTEFKKQYPQVELELVEERTYQLEEHLLRGSLDLIIDNRPFDEKIFERYLYYSEHLLLAVPREFQVNREVRDYTLSFEEVVEGRHLSEDIPAVPLKAFQREPFVFLKSENDTARHAMKICQSHGFQPDILLKTDQQITAYNITCSGFGISFIGDMLIRYEQPNPNVYYYKLDGEEAIRNIYFYKKRGKYTTRAMEEFLRIVGSRRVEFA
ncbi:MAG: LysR family transcriptional regulator [Eubacteriales bacterium]|nr:LysR family transcriptional regulator [Eubacteriales bacterium]